MKPVPPVRRFADTVRATIDLMARSGFGGHDAIALTLARAGWKVSARSVRRITAKRPHLSPGAPALATGRPVIARFVNHVWMMDLTEVRSFLGLRVFHVAAVFDSFSRATRSANLRDEARRARMARLLVSTAKAFSAPSRTPPASASTDP